MRTFTRSFSFSLVVVLASCSRDPGPGSGRGRGGDSLGAHGDPLSLDPSIPFLDFDQNADTPKTIALTFDDGPDDTYCSQVLDTLKSYGVKATFFINTENYTDVSTDTVAQSVIERMWNEGHQIGNHTVDHTDLMSLSSSGDVAELDGVYQTMKSLVPGALQYRFVRAPYGDPYFGPQSELDRIAPIVAQYGVHVGWNIDPQDWACNTDSCVVNGVLSAVDSGLDGIVLLHCTQQHTASALPTILTGLQNRGMRFVQVEDLVLAKYGVPSRDLIFCSTSADCWGGETCGADGHCAPSGTTSDAGTGDTATGDSGTSDTGTTDAGTDASDGGTDSGGVPQTVYCSSLTVQSGALVGGYESDACGPSGALAVDDGVTVAWQESSTSTKTVAYATYALSGTPKTMSVDLAFLGDDDTEPLWYWELWNPSTGAWVTIGDNSWAGNWVTTEHSFSIASPASYVDASGHVKLRFHTKTSTNSAELDREVLTVSY